MPTTPSITLGAHDVHIVVSRTGRKAKCFVAGGALRWTIEARCEGSDGPGWNEAVVGGDTPLGRYLITAVEPLAHSDPQWRSFGWFYLWLAELDGQETKYGRAGVGWHGGGSGCPDPWAPFQGWTVTHGCIRSQNEDLQKRVVPSVNWALKNGGKCYLSVVS